MLDEIEANIYRTKLAMVEVVKNREEVSQRSSGDLYLAFSDVSNIDTDEGISQKVGDLANSSYGVNELQLVTAEQPHQ